MDSANRYVRKIRGSLAGNDVSLLAAIHFPVACYGARVVAMEGKGLRERSGILTVVLSYQEVGSWHVLYAEFYTFRIYFKLRICVQCSFCQLKKGRTLLTRWLINTFHQKKIVAVFGVALSTSNTRQSSW
jgi:hypothetical protein